MPKSLEHDYLKNFHSWAVEAAQSVTTQITNSDVAVSEDRVCATALRFMLQVLNWDFSNSGRVVKNSLDVFSFVAKEDSYSSYTLVQAFQSQQILDSYITPTRILEVANSIGDIFFS